MRRIPHAFFTLLLAFGMTPSIFAEDSELAGLPAAFRSPETGIGLGAVLIYTADTSLPKPSPIFTGLMYTEKKQILLGFGSKQIFENGRYAYYSFGEAAKFPQKFYGTGNQTRRKDEEVYEDRHYSVDLGGEYNVVSALSLGFGLHAREDSNGKFEDEGLFDRNLVAGQDGGKQKGYMAYAAWDTTNDSFYPNTGSRIKLFYLNYLGPWGSRYPFDEVKLDARVFRQITPGVILASQLYLRNANSNPPFYQLSLLGGNEQMRGYFKGRYRERKSPVMQTELRAAFAKDWGAVAFASLGNVYRDWDDFQPKTLKTGYGAGLRYQITPKQKINLRVDVGFGEPRDGPQFYIYIMEAY